MKLTNHTAFMQFLQKKCSHLLLFSTDNKRIENFNPQILSNESLCVQNIINHTSREPSVVSELISWQMQFIRKY